MADLTHGYDVMIQLKARFITAIVHAMQGSGIIPDRIDVPAEAMAFYPHLEIFLKTPDLELGGPDAQGEILSLQLPIIIRADNIFGEVQGLATIPVAAERVPALRDGVETQSIVINTSQVQFADVALTLDPMTPMLTPLAAALRDRLALFFRELGVLPISPSIPGGAVSVDFGLARGKNFPNFRGEGQEMNFLALYVDIDERAPDDPATRPLKPDSLLSLTGPDCAVAINGPVFLTPMREALAAAGLVAGKKFAGLNQSITDLGVFEVKLRAITLTQTPTIGLTDGFLVLGGAISADIDNAPDVDAKFLVQLIPQIDADGVTAIVAKVDVDASVQLGSILGAVLATPVISSIADLFKDLLNGKIEEAIVGQSFSQPIDPFTTFLGAIEVTTAPEAATATALLVHPQSFRFTSGGLIVQSELELVYEAAPTHPLTYVIGNDRSFQFHRQGECQYGNVISKPHRRIFVGPREALAEGYDGCGECFSTYHNHGAAGVALMYERAFPPGQPQAKARKVSIRGAFEGDPEAYGAKEPFEIDLEITPNLKAVHTGQAQLRLAQGKWRIDIDDDDWTDSATVTLKSAEDTSFLFRHGQAHKDV